MFENVIPKQSPSASDTYNPYTPPQAENRLLFTPTPEPSETGVYRLDVPAEVAFQRKTIRNQAIFSAAFLALAVCMTGSTLIGAGFGWVASIIGIGLATFIPGAHLAMLFMRYQRVEREAQSFRFEIATESISRFREGYRPVTIARNDVTGVALYPRAALVFGASPREKLALTDRVLGWENMRDVLRALGPERPFLALREPLFVGLLIGAFYSLQMLPVSGALVVVGCLPVLGLVGRAAWVAWCSPNLRYDQRLGFLFLLGLACLGVLFRMALAR